MSRSAGVSLGHSEKMICQSCFRTKGDGDFKLPCQNPKCHFYLCTPNSLSSYGGDVYPSELSLSPSFNPEVGFDRKTRPYLRSPQNLKTLDYFGQDCSSQLTSKSPKMPHATTLPKTRSKSTNSATGTAGLNIQRLLSSYQSSRILQKDKHCHSRMVSLPEYTDSYLRRDLVEDAFASSPLLIGYGGKDEDRVRRSLQHAYSTFTDGIFYTCCIFCIVLYHHTRPECT